MIGCFVPLMATLWVYAHSRDLMVLNSCLAVMGFLIFGPQLLIGVSMVDFVPKRAVATANGMTGTFGYLGGDMLAKMGLGYMSDALGWKSVFLSMALHPVFAAYPVRAAQGRKPPGT